REQLSHECHRSKNPHRSRRLVALSDIRVSMDPCQECFAQRSAVRSASISVLSFLLGALMRVVVKTVLLMSWFVLASNAAFAQAVIAGSVKDSSGAVLPGVTVEAASPALIEKTRTAVSDGTGQYRIEDLRPGTYTVTFTLQGFSTFKREGIELTGSFTATVNAELKVGSLSETITVTGETPVVDIQSAKREMTLNK